jgi:endonuclease-8
MPEGPEIRRAADALQAAVVDQPLTEVWFAFAELKPYQKQLLGQRIQSITPRGKALLTRFENDLTLYSHNQLYGVWRVTDAGKRPASQRSLRVALQTADRAILLYSASDISMWPSAKVHEHPFLQRIGPDVLDPQLDEDLVFGRLRGTRFAGRRLGGLLLDQSFLAGLGNYLRAETLWQAGLAPSHRPRELDDTACHALAHALLDVPRRSYRTRGRRGSRLQDTPFRFNVYARTGKPCPRCAHPIVRSHASGRPMFTCPHCQR